MKQKQSWLPKAIASLCCSATLVGSTALADTLTPSLTFSATPGVWGYDVDFTSGELHPGDGFTIVDFGGYVAGSIYAPAGGGVGAGAWLTSITAVGSPWGPVPPLDELTCVNLHFTYSGPVLETTGRLSFGPFGGSTTSTTTATDDWVSMDHTLGTAGVINGVPGSTHTDKILVPACVVPDGGLTLSLLGFALVGLEGLRRKLSFVK